MKILVIQQKMIGDVLTSSILFEAIKEKYPDAKTSYIINSSTADVVKNNPFIDRIILVTPEIESKKLKFLSFLKTVKKSKYDVIIDPYSKISSNLISIFSRAKTKISFYKKHTSFLYDFNIKRKNDIDITTNRLRLLKPLDIDKKNIKPKIYLTDQEVLDAENYLETNGLDVKKPIFMISILGSSHSKTYPISYMAQLVDFIVAETDGQILFNYIPNQISEVKNLFNFCKKDTKTNIYFDVYGKNLRHFLAITKHCSALIGNEGGAINMAKALKIPTFAIFSPWINKKGWNLFEDGKTVDSIHLVDCKPNLFTDKKPATIKAEYTELYQAFTPELIIPKLKSYLNQL